jgi:hypothetical protein
MDLLAPIKALISAHERFLALRFDRVTTEVDLLRKATLAKHEELRDKPLGIHVVFEGMVTVKEPNNEGGPFKTKDVTYKTSYGKRLEIHAGVGMIQEFHFPQPFRIERVFLEGPYSFSITEVRVGNTELLNYIPHGQQRRSVELGLPVTTDASSITYVRVERYE